MNMCMIQVYDMCLYMSMHAVCMPVRTRTHALFAYMRVHMCHWVCMKYRRQPWVLVLSLPSLREDLLFSAVYASLAGLWVAYHAVRVLELQTESTASNFTCVLQILNQVARITQTFYTLVQQAFLNPEIILRNAGLHMPLLHNLWMLVSFYVSCQKREWELVLL